MRERYKLNAIIEINIHFQKYKFTFPADDKEMHYPLREDRIYGRHPPMMDPDAYQDFGAFDHNERL